MKYEELTAQEKTNVKKYIKEELLSTQKVKTPINPNEFTYEHKRGAMQIVGKLGSMSDRQINSYVIKSVKERLKQVKN